MQRLLTLALCLVAVSAFAQTPAPAPTSFAESTFSFALTPVTLPSLGQTLSGAETDLMLGVSTNNLFGETTLISSSPFVGGRYERVFPSVAKYIQQHTALSGPNFQPYITVSGGIVKTSTKNYWGERAGIGFNYAPAGSKVFGIGVDLEANNLVGITHWRPSVAVTPTFHF